MKWKGHNIASLELCDLSTFKAMTPGLLQNLAISLQIVTASKSVRALVIQAAGPHFCTGGRYDRKASPSSLWWVKAQGLHGSGHLINEIRSVSMHSISVFHGSSIGGGLLLGLACDHRLATASAVFRLGVAPYGLSPVLMATTVLPDLVGQNFAV